MLLRNFGQSTDARSHDTTDPPMVFFLHIQIGFLGRLDRGGNRDMGKGIETTDLLCVDIVRGIEILDLSPEADPHPLRIKFGDRGNSALSGKQVFPDRVYIITKGGDTATTGDDNAPTCHPHFPRCT